MKIFGAACILIQLICVISLILPINCTEDNRIGETYEVEKSDVTFRLYSRQNANTYIELVTGNLAGAKVDPKKPFKFIIHGYTDSADRLWVLEMKDAYLRKGDYNVIAVDWSGPAFALYTSSAWDTRAVGKYVGALVLDLMNTLSVPPGNFHLIGHSLGSHISGFAGKHVIANGSKIARITGMDPAGPLFLLNSADDRLSIGDADFVDSIHTDGGKFGYYDRIAHADFYPEAGTATQPGCIITRVNFDWAACSHIRSYKLFTESINSSDFIAKECTSFLDYIYADCDNNAAAIMGENIDPATRGRFYLRTNGESPYATSGKRHLI